MGVNHSSKKRNANIQGRATSSAPTTTDNSRNGSSSSFQKQQKSATKSSVSTGRLRFLSDEIKPNTDRSICRQSSLKFLHESIGIGGKPKSKVQNNNVDIHRDIDQLKSKIVSDDANNFNDLKTDVSVSLSPTQKCDNRREADDIDYKIPNDHINNIKEDSETINFSAKNEIDSKSENTDSITENGIHKPDSNYCSKKPIFQMGISKKSDITVEQNISPNLIAKPEVGTVTFTSKAKQTNSSNIKPKTERTLNIISKPERPAFINKIKHEEIDKPIQNQELEASSINGFCSKSEADYEKSLKPNISDNFHRNKERSIIVADDHVTCKVATSSSTSTTSSIVCSSSDVNKIPSTSLVNSVCPMSVNKTDTVREKFTEEGDKTITRDVKLRKDTFVHNYADILIKSIISNIYLELADNFKQTVNINKSNLNKNDTIDILPALDTEVTTVDKFTEDTPVDDKCADISLVANSMSCKILNNVLKEFELLTEKTPLKRYSNEIDVVVQNKLNDCNHVVNEIQRESLDECDSVPPKNSHLSNSCKDIITSSDDSVIDINNQDVKAMGNVNGTKNKENIQKVIENSVNYLSDTPKIVLTENEKHPVETKRPTVVLRRNHSRKKAGRVLSTPIIDDNKVRYSGTDRPLSGFAEQLAELLGEDPDLDLEFDSDAELPDALEKIKEKTDKPELSVEIGRIQRKCSRVELNEYGVKKFKSKVQLKLTDKKSKLKGDRPLSLYEQDLLSDLLKNEEEFDDYNEVDTELVESVQSSVQRLEDKIPLINRDLRTSSNVSSTSNEDYDSLDECTKIHRSETKTVSTEKAPDIGQAAVIDLGSGILKAGMCGDMKPSCYCPSVIGVPRRLSQDVSKMKKGYYVGDEAWTMAGMLSIDYPIKQRITNWPDVTSIIEHLLDIELKISDNHPVMITEMSLGSSKQRERLTEIMFETFNVPAFYLANQASLALYSMGMTTGLCLNSGFDCTQSVPVYEGCTVPYATHQLDIGGDHVSNHLGRILLGTQGQVFNTSSEKLVLNTMKQSLCYVAQDPTVEDELYKSTANMLRTYTLPDGQEIELSTERFLAPEILFDPGILGLNKPNVAELVQQSVERVERSLSPLLNENVLVCGGTTKFSGFGPRLEKELQLLSRNGESYNVKYVDNPLLATWIGGSVLSSIASFRDQWITIDQYAESGSKIVHKVCF